MQSRFRHSLIATLLKSLAALSAFLPNIPVLASELGIVNNELFIEEDWIDGPLPLYPLGVSGDGVIDPLQNMATSGGLEFPRYILRFGFNDIDDGNYQLAAGFIVDEVGSARRIEMKLPGMVITVSDNGATLTGTIEDNQSIVVYARLNASSETQAEIDGTGTLKFEGASAKLVFDPSVAIRSAGEYGGSLGGFINNMDSAGQRYNYTLVLQPLDAQGNPQLNREIQFGQNPGRRFNAYPSSLDDFQLFNSALAGIFNGGNRIGGTISFASFITVQCAPGQVPITNELGENQSCVDLASRPGFPLLDAEAELVDLIDRTRGLLAGGRANNDAVDRLITQTASLLDDAILVLSDPAFRNREGVVAFDSALSEVLGLVDRNLANGGINDAGAISSMLAKASDLLSVLGNRAAPMTIDELETATTAIRLSIDSLSGIFQSQRLEQQLPLLGPGTDSGGEPAADQMSVLSGQSELAFTTSVMDSIARAVNASVALGARINSPLRDSLTKLSGEALAVVLDDVAAQVGLALEFSDSTSTRDLLEEYPQLISPALSVVGIQLLPRRRLDVLTIQNRLRDSGMSAPAAGALSSLLSSYTNPEDIVLFPEFSQISTAEYLTAALGEGARIYFDEESSVTVLSYPDMDRPVNITRVDLVSSSFPEGVIDLPDGSLYVAAGNTASIALPALANIFDFASLVNSSSGGLALSSEATLRISTDEFVFSGILPFGQVSMNLTGTTDIGFREPDVFDPTDPRYQFRVTFGEGGEQPIAPYFNDPAFFKAIENEGFDYTIDRETGIITISGTPFRPDYFVTEPGFDDLVYRSREGSPAITFRPVDSNGDGITDYRVIIGNTVQAIYGMPTDR